MLVGIVGYREFDDFILFENYISEWELNNGKITKIISGGCRGVDSLAKEYAQKYKIDYLEYKAEWDLYGKSAGAKRNKKIVDSCDHLVAFLSSNSLGTKITIDMAKRSNKKVTIFDIK